MLIDQAVITVRSGKGGDGIVAFLRMKYIPKGGPAGGDGGKGGDVYLVATVGVDTLLDFSGRHHWFADNGKPGSNKQKHGADGADLDIRLPAGTLVYNNDTGELLCDLTKHGDRVRIAEGGKGGFGNEHFKSATNQTPRTCTQGDEGEELTLRLELKLVADVGLIGKPNAGKSTLLSRITKARPKIADYPFTTLEPNLGIAQLPGDFGGRRLVFADIPGLIEGAAEGAGLGHAFLRHIERTRVLVHLIEIEPTDDSDPAENYRVIREELARFSATLATKPQLVAVSKMDLLSTDEDRRTAVELIEQATGRPVIPISSADSSGMSELLEACWDIVQNAKQQELIQLPRDEQSDSQDTTETQPSP